MKEPLKRTHSLWDWISFKIMEKYGWEEFFAIFDNEEPSVWEIGRLEKVKSSKWWEENVLKKTHSHKEYEEFRETIRNEIKPYLRPMFDKTFKWIDLSIWPKTDIYTNR